MRSESERPPRRVLFVRRAWSGRCPQCGEGRLFEKYARLAAACESCGLVYRREQGAMTGSMYLSAAVTELFAALLVLLLWVATDWSTWTSISVGLAILLAFAYWWLPRSMALWTAIEYATDVNNREPWVLPRP